MPRLVETLKGVKVVGWASGSEHTLACTDQGQLYTFGWGGVGQLGHGVQKDELLPRATALVL